MKDLIDRALEIKSRKVRTPEGARRFKQPIGSPIVKRPRMHLAKVKRGKESPLARDTPGPVRKERKPVRAAPKQQPHERTVTRGLHGRREIVAGEDRYKRDTEVRRNRTDLQTAHDYDRGFYGRDWTTGNEDPKLLTAAVADPNGPEAKELADQESARLGIQVGDNVPPALHRLFNRVADQYDRMYGEGFMSTHIPYVAGANFPGNIIAANGLVWEPTNKQVVTGLALGHGLRPENIHEHTAFFLGEADPEHYFSVKGHQLVDSRPDEDPDDLLAMATLHHEVGHTISRIIVGAIGPASGVKYPEGPPTGSMHTPELWGNGNDWHMDLIQNPRSTTRVYDFDAVAGRLIDDFTDELRDILQDHDLAEPYKRLDKRNFPAVTEDALQEDLWRFTLHPGLVANAISDYGSTNMTELLAEVWAAYQWDRVGITDPVRDIGELMEQYMTKALDRDARLRGEA